MGAAVGIVVGALAGTDLGLSLVFGAGIGVVVGLLAEAIVVARSNA